MPSSSDWGLCVFAVRQLFTSQQLRVRVRGSASWGVEVETSRTTLADENRETGYGGKTQPSDVMAGAEARLKRVEKLRQVDDSERD